MFKISFGASNNNSRNVNFNRMLVEPTIVAPVDLPPGYYAVTLVRTDIPYMQWITVNIPSTFKKNAGSTVLVYEPPLIDPLIPSPVPLHFIATLWRQSRGRFTPPPRAPQNRASGAIDRFAKRNGLVEVVSRSFTVQP